MEGLCQRPVMAQRNRHKTVSALPGNEFSGVLVIHALLIEAIEEVKDRGCFESRGLRIQKALYGCNGHNRVQVRQERNEDYGTHAEYRGQQAPAYWTKIENGALRVGHEGLHFAVQPFACHRVSGNHLDERGIHTWGDKLPRSGL